MAKRRVQVVNTRDYNYIIASEGESGGQSRTLSSSYVSTNLPVGSGPQVGPGRALLVDSVTFSASEDVTFNGFIGYGDGSLYPPYRSAILGTTFLQRGIPLTLPQRFTLRNSSIGSNLTITNVVKSGVTPGTSIPFTFTAYFAGSTITDDFNFNADFVLNIISDSIGDGSGMTNALDMWVFKVRNYLISQGKNVRLRNWSVSGSTLVQHDNAFKAGKYNYNEPGMTIICLGTNDAGAASGTILSGAGLTNATNSFQSIINQTQLLFPKQKVVVVGPATLGTANNETNLVNVSAAQASYVSTIAKSNVIFVPRTIFTANTTNLQVDNVHPTAIGQGLIAANIINAISTPSNGILTSLV